MRKTPPDSTFGPCGREAKIILINAAKFVSSWGCAASLRCVRVPKARKVSSRRESRDSESTCLKPPNVHVLGFSYARQEDKLKAIKTTKDSLCIGVYDASE